MKYKFWAVLMVCSLHINAQVNTIWPSVNKEMKPWIRWWWMGSAVDENNIKESLKKYQNVGFGGVEITPVYGAKGFENKYIPFLSPQWLSMLQFSVSEAKDLGMGLDMNLGTGWPFGGPQINVENAASKMIIQKYQLEKGEKLNVKILAAEPKQTEAGLQALRAYNEKGQQIDILRYVLEDGTLNWSPSAGKWKIIALFCGKTRQMVKRSAPGGEGFTLDHLNKKAVSVYLDRFSKAFAGRSFNVRSFFNDSYEVYGANWSLDFLAQFKQIKKYDLADCLPELTDTSFINDKVARIKSDYREVMNVLLQENFLKEFSDFSNKHQSLSRNQAHGSPGNLIDLYAATDIAECETFGSSFFNIPGLRREAADIRSVDPDPVMFKFATSATNTQGKKYTSAETFTWLTEHFKTSLSQTKPEVEQLFLAGVNHVFYHGTTYSPKEVAYPGWLFYASVNFVPGNSFWSHLNGLNEYVTRVQSVLQTSKSDNEILIYWPIFDIWNNSKELYMALSVHNIDKWLHPTAFYTTSLKLANTGYAFDFATDKIIANSKVRNAEISTNDNALAYKTLIIPESNLMPVATLLNIIERARAGAKVIFQSLPKDVPGWGDLDNRRARFKSLLAGLNFKEIRGLKRFAVGQGEIILSSDIRNALEHLSIVREQLTDKGLKFTRRVDRGDIYYYIVNHSSRFVNEFIPLNGKGKQAIILDPQTGVVGEAQTENLLKEPSVRVQIKSGEALLVKISQSTVDIAKWRYLGEERSSAEIKSVWNLSFTSTGPEVPASRKLKVLKSWTDFGDEIANKFSGTGIYKTNFEFNPDSEAEYVLNLGKVSESARVWINDQEVGYIWSIPFEARIGRYLKKGKNTITVEVKNLMSNSIRDLDQQGVRWRNYAEINFVNINYRNFDAKDWELMSSGLLGPVKIIEFR